MDPVPPSYQSVKAVPPTLPSLRKICNLTWKDKVPNTTALDRCKISSVESFVTRTQLRWAGRVVRMSSERIP